MTNMPFFSVVIPLYNKEQYVAATVDSVLKQSFSDFELIIVDDCSTDASIDKIPADDRITVIRHAKNQGLSATRNTGIRAAKTEFIAFLDSDDVWKPFFLEKMHELIGQFPNAGLFAAAYEEVYGHAAVGVNKNIALAADEMSIIADFFSANSHQPIFCYSSVVVKRAVFDSVGFFDENITLGEDVDFNIRANIRYKLAYYNRICAGYTIFSENQITNSSVCNKTVTDFKKYEMLIANSPSLKQYLDINRYVLAMQYKMAGDTVRSDAMLEQIDRSNLTSLQKLLLGAPLWMVGLLRHIKQRFLRKGIRLTTFKD